MSKVIIGKITELNDDDYKPNAIKNIDIPNDISQIILRKEYLDL